MGKPRELGRPTVDIRVLQQEGFKDLGPKTDTTYGVDT